MSSCFSMSHRIPSSLSRFRTLPSPPLQFFLRPQRSPSPRRFAWTIRKKANQSTMPPPRRMPTSFDRSPLPMKSKRKQPMKSMCGVKRNQSAVPGGPVSVGKAFSRYFGTYRAMALRSSSCARVASSSSKQLPPQPVLLVLHEYWRGTRSRSRCHGM